MPDTIVDAEVVEAAVALACRAPSLHNTQPWLWTVTGGELQLYLDRDRLVSYDRSGRQAIISCGTALDHLRAAMSATGWASHVERFPNPNNLDHLASLTFTSGGFITDAQRRRADAIMLRRTDRLPFGEPKNFPALEPLLRAAGETEDVLLDVLPDAARSQLVEASHLTDALRMYDSEYHAEMAWWTAPFELFDGIPHSALVSAAESDRVDVGRLFPVVKHPERRMEIGDDRSAIVVLSTPNNTTEDALRCGEALSSVLLEATMAGLSTCPLTHLTEVDASRQIVASLIGRDIFPQVLIRLGVAPMLDEIPPPTPRRPIDDVLRRS